MQILNRFRRNTHNVQINLEWHRLQADIKNNSRNLRFLVALILFRSARITLCMGPIGFLLGLPIRILYTIYVKILLSIDISIKTDIGGGLQIYHGTGIVIHPQAKLGDNVLIRHGVTIGEKTTNSGLAPIIGNGVDIGCQATILGNIQIGDHSIIGASTLLLSDIPNYSVVVGSPGRIIKRLQEDAVLDVDNHFI